MTDQIQSDQTPPKSAYESKVVEAKWTEFWFSRKLFDLRIEDGKPNYSIALPPPNITGSLHMGHAFNGTLQDMLIRYKRMSGFNVLWQPGTDHAGISAQMVVERKLREQGRNRHEMGREAFLAEVWSWRKQFGDTIFEQYKRLGVSFCWERPAFTMDAAYASAVTRAFVQLYREGYIYRGERITNWCSRCETTLSDLEVEKEDENENSPGHCERCHTLIERKLSDQWYLRMKDLAKSAIDAVQEGRIKFVPERTAETYFTWLENVLDWNISRQLWWGHQIPIWTCDNGHADAYESAPAQCSCCESTALTQDSDVLDTWFSSALWPFATLGWPEESALRARFYPTAAISTAREIINLWVSRMIFMSLKFTGEIPFQDILIHPVIQTPDGKRMTKSKGNAIDPLDMIEKYGTDANRLYFATLGIKGDQDVRFHEERLGEYKRFANKLFNAGRFIQRQLKDKEPGAIEASKLSLADRWILTCYNKMLQRVEAAFAAYDFDEVAHQLYDFTWSLFCDWYLEIAKTQIAGGAEETTCSILHSIYDGLLRAFHPIMPFITEELWHELGDRAEQSIMFAPYPVADSAFINEQADRDMSLLIRCIREIRNLKQTFNVPASAQPDALIVGGDADDARALAEGLGYISALARVKASTGDDASRPANAATAIVSSIKIYVPLAKVIDLDKTRARLSQRREKLESDIARSNKTLANPGFLAKAGQEKIDALKQSLADLQTELNGTLAQLAVLAP